jgi:hypothetical protein
MGLESADIGSTMPSVKPTDSTRGGRQSTASEVASTDPKAAYHAVSGNAEVYNVLEAGRFTCALGACSQHGRPP